MADIPIFPGSSSFFPGSTPFGFYDHDYQFQQDADKVALFCARRLGYPVLDVELQDKNFYAAFEQAVTTYGNEVYAYKVQQDYLTLEGHSTEEDLNNSVITPNFGTIVRISQQYGTEAGTGGNVEYYTGSLPISKGQQNYNLDSWASSSLGVESGDLEIKRVFYEAPPAIAKYFDPYTGTGTGMMNFLDNFGWGNYSPSVNFLLMPISFDIQKIQGIELNDQVRKSQYSFELKNNKLRLFPIPHYDGSLKIEFIKKSERLANSIDNTEGKISDVSKVPYSNPTYSKINSIGRSWIFEYTLAVSKEILGYIRGKYQNIPIPDQNISLNQSDLITSAKDTKDQLIEKLRNYLESTSREKLLEQRSKETEYRKIELEEVPRPIYIG